MCQNKDKIDNFDKLEMRKNEIVILKLKTRAVIIKNSADGFNTVDTAEGRISEMRKIRKRKSRPKH